MGLFRGRWKKKEQQLNERFGAAGVAITGKDAKNANKIEQYVVERLEQIIELAREVEEEKSEYKKINSYLNDIQILENLSEEEKKKVTETAVNVGQLNTARNDFLNSTRKLTDVQFAQLESQKDDIPAAIKRLAANEVYRDTLKKDMNYLEREKAEWTLHREYLGSHKRNLKNLVYVCFGLAATVAVTLLLLQFVFRMDTYNAWIVLMIVTVAAVCCVLFKVQNDDSDFIVAEKNMNRAILLQNKVKIKYVNIANAIDYACEKYHARNAKELNQLWEYYLEAVKEREKYQRTSEDLEYFNGRLVRMLAQFKLYDPQIWISQVMALIEPKEMVEIKHDLVTRRQKLRDRLKFNLVNIRQMEREAEQAIAKVTDTRMKPQLQEILQSIHRLSKII